MIPTLFTASCLWQGPSDSEKIIYFSGTSKQEFTNVSLVDSEDSEYTSGTAFKLIGANSDDLGRVYKLSVADEITLNVSSSVNFGIDDYKGYIVFESPISTTNVKATIKRYYASIHTSNLTSFEKVIDFKHLKERAITAMVASDAGIYLSGISGKVWFYNGDYIKGPIFILQDNNEDISSSTMISHQFEHETEAYLYVGSDQLPRLFRAKLNTAYNGSQWEQVYPFGELAASSGGILSLASAYNKLFIGCRNKKVHRYLRTQTINLKQPTNLITEEVVESFVETETLSTSTLYSNNIGDFEAKDFGIKCLSVGKNQVFAGIDRKSEIWSYSEIPIGNPEQDDKWSSYLFDEVFLGDPAPAQYYSYDSNTLSRDDSNLAIARFNNNKNIQGYDEFLVIKGNTETSLGATAYGSRFFEFSEGSDWEQLIGENLPDQSFINIQCASFEAIASWNNFLSLDGYDLQDNDLFLLKDQTSAGTNGIYNGIYKYNGANSDPTSILVSNYIVSGNRYLGFYVQNGYINLGSRWLLDYNEVLNSNLYNFYKPSYTIEFELTNLSQSDINAESVLRDSTKLYSVEQVLTQTNSGYQGIEISDLYGNFSLEFNSNNVRLSSGTNVETKTLISTGIVQDWQFYEVSSGVASTSLQEWTSRSFVSSLTPEVVEENNILNDVVEKYVVNLQPTLTGNPSIQIENLSLNVDLNSIILIKFKVSPKSQNLSNSSVRAYWAYDNGQFIQFSDTEIHTVDDYVEYTIKPVWNGEINKLCIEFANLPENSQRPDHIFIEYIQVVSDENIFDLNKKLSKVRLIVEDKDVKVYLGNQYYPFLFKKNFITLDTFNPKLVDSTSTVADYDKPYIRFGKLNNDAGDSLFGYSKVSYIVGEIREPFNSKIIDFNQCAKLSSTNGIRLFAYHDGTLYCATDGFISSKVSENPNDRQSKLFYYKSDAEAWFKEDVPFDRKKVFDASGNYDLLGIVRPLTALSFKGRLFLSGHYGSIKTS